MGDIEMNMKSNPMIPELKQKQVEGTLSLSDIKNWGSSNRKKEENDDTNNNAKVDSANINDTNDDTNNNANVNNANINDTNDDTNDNTNVSDTNNMSIMQYYIQKYKITDRILTVLTCLFIVLILFSILYLFDVTLANNNHGAYPDNRIWWSLPILQSVFTISVFITIAEASVRFGRGTKIIPIQIKIFLQSITLIIFLLYVTLPSYTIVDQLKPAIYKLKQNYNCVDLNNDLSNSQRKDLKLACPMYKPFSSMMLTTSSYWKIANKTNINFNVLIRLIKTIEDLRPLIPIILKDMREESSWHGVSKYAKLFFHHQCSDSFADTSCTMFFTSCSFSNCKPVGEKCEVSHTLDRWISCTRHLCGTQQGYINCNENVNVDSLIVAFRSLEFDLMRLIANGDYDGLFDSEILKLVPYSINISRSILESHTIKNMNKNINYKSSCNEYMDDSIENNNDVNRIFGCNPMNRTQIGDQQPIYYNSAFIYLYILFPLLFVFIFIYGDHRPFLKYESYREVIGRFISFFMGMVASCFIYLRGINLERSSFESSVNRYNINYSLQFWSFCYFTISSLMIRHSLLLLLPSSYTIHLVSDVTRIALAKEQNSKMTHLERVEHRENRRREMISRRSRRRTSGGRDSNMNKNSSRFSHRRRTTHGGIERFSCIESFRLRYTHPGYLLFKKCNEKYFLIIFLFRELFEVSVQFIGILQLALFNDINQIFVSVTVLSTNLIVLPFITYVSNKFYGKIFAKGVVVLIERLFDRIFVIVSVLFSLNRSENKNVNIGEQIIRHAPALVPALGVILVSSTAFISIAKTFDEQDRKKRDQAARILQRAFRIGILRFENAKFAIDYMENKVKSKTKMNNTTTMITLYSSGVLSILFGLILWLYTMISINLQSNKCYHKFGSISYCMKPRIYFSNGFFSKTSCSLMNVEVINCTGNEIHTTIHIKDTMEYQYLVNVTHIDISSSSSKLKSIPSSWSLMKQIKFINISNNPQFINLPWNICNLQTAPVGLNVLGSIDLKNTLASKEIDWSGITAGHDSNSSASNKLMISNGCRVLDKTLSKLSLADNHLITDDIVDILYKIGTNVSILNLTNNNIYKMNKDLYVACNSITSNNGNIILNNNPIQDFSMSGYNVNDVSLWTDYVKNAMLNVQFPSLKSLAFSAITNGGVRNIIAKLKSISSIEKIKIDAVGFDCQDNSIQYGDQSPFPKNLKEFDSSDCFSTVDNRMNSVVGKTIFRNNIFLEKLDLTDNQIVSIDKDAFIDCQNLKFLNIEFNRISNFEFLNNTYKNLIELKLNENKYDIHSFEKILYQNKLPMLRRLSVDLYLMNINNKQGNIYYMNQWFENIPHITHLLIQFNDRKNNDIIYNNVLNLTSIILPKSLQCLSINHGNNRSGGIYIPKNYFLRYNHLIRLYTYKYIIPQNESVKQHRIEIGLKSHILWKLDDVDDKRNDENEMKCKLHTNVTELFLTANPSNFRL